MFFLKSRVCGLCHLLCGFLYLKPTFYLLGSLQRREGEKVVFVTSWKKSALSHHTNCMSLRASGREINVFREKFKEDICVGKWAFKFFLCLNVPPPRVQQPSSISGLILHHRPSRSSKLLLAQSSFTTPMPTWPRHVMSTVKRTTEGFGGIGGYSGNSYSDLADNCHEKM